MQVYALEKKQLISSIKAEKGKNYLCPECFNPLRVRGGKERQSHFFHLQQNLSCRLAQKGEIHLRLQRFVNYLFNNSEMEKSYPSIGRIADVADEKSKIIYEIQYSPISQEEAKQRCRDYESIGYQIVWILHDHTFNQKKQTPAERFLRTKTCYFSNMDEKGNGMIYDQLEEVGPNFRNDKTHYSPINLRIRKKLPSKKWPKELHERCKTWPIYHEGDFIDLAVKRKLTPFKQIQRPFFLSQLKEGYLTFLQFLLMKLSQ